MGEFHLDKKYRKLRDRFIRENPLCRLCFKEEGLTVAASEVDHIKPLKTHPELAMDRSNLQALCRNCHEKKTARENNRFVGADAEGNPL